MDEQSLFAQVLDIPDAGERAAFLDRACGGNTELRLRIDRLLERYQAAGSFLERPLNPPAGTLPFAPAVAAEAPGSIIGSYKLLEQVGEGGFGVVFMAEQTHPVRRRVALKVIKPGMDTRGVVARFEAERQALALMDHPNIAKVFDGGETAGRPYFVMELVRGVPITEFCDHNHLGVRDRLGLFVDVCRAVQHAHLKGIIHRDLKPTNVMVTLHDGVPVPKVIDFGIAKATGQPLTDKTLFTNFAQMIGTPLYMSPEQAELSGLDVDTRTDIYSLGVLLYELLTGTTPFDRDRLRTVGLDEVRRIIREEEPARPSARMSTLGIAAGTVSANRKSDPGGLSRLFRGELDWIVMKALEKDRNRRYETANSLAIDVMRYLADEPVQACPPTAAYRFRKFARRNKRAVVTAGAVGLTVVLTVAGLATSTVLIAQSLKSETEAKVKLDDALRRERVDAYFHRITLAHHALGADDLGRALELLKDCPNDLRGWEWDYLMRLCRVEPLVLRDQTEVNSVAFSPDGQFIAAACGDATIKVWDSKTGKVARRLDATHSGPVFSVAFNTDGQHLASVGADKLVKVWELTTGHKVFERPCDAVPQVGTAYGVAFSPLNPNHLAAGCDGTVTIWDWKNELPVHIFPGHVTQRISVAFSRDGRQLATGDWRGSVKLWDTVSGGGPHDFPASRETRQPACALAFSRDGERLAAASFGRRVDVWDTTTGKLLHTLPHNDTLVMCVACSPDGLRLASAGEDKTVRVWDATTGRLLLGLRGHAGMCGCVTFSPDGLRLASASLDGTIRVWDATPLQGHERQEAASFTEHNNEVWSVAVSPVAPRIASAGQSMPAVVWDANTRQVSTRFLSHSGICFCVAWHPDGQRVASAGWDGALFTVKVWDAQTGRDEFTLPGSLPGGPEFYAVAFSPDGQHLVTGSANGAVRVWKARTGEEVRTLGTHKFAVRGVVFSPDRRHLASVSTDGEVKMWDASRLGAGLDAELEPRRTPLSAHVPGACLNVAFSPDGKRIAMGGKDHTIKICDVETGQVLSTLLGHSRDVYTVAFSTDTNGRWLASTGEDSTVRVWDSNTGKLIRTFRGHTSLVATLAFVDGRTLISGSRDHTIKIWDLTPLEGESGR